MFQFSLLATYKKVFHSVPAGKLYFGGKLEESDVAKIWVIIQKIINEEKAGNNKLGIKSYYQQKDCSRYGIAITP